MTTIGVIRPRAVADPPRQNHELLDFTQMVEQKLANNTTFAAVGAVLTNLTASRVAFEQALANKGTQKGVGNALSAAKQGVFDNLNHAKDFVNSVAEKAPPDQANAIIESSGFRVRKVVVKSKLPIDVKYGGLSGVVLLVALGAGRTGTYYFQVSTDQKSWTSCPNVMKCQTIVANLTVGTLYYFRVQVQTSKGLSDWSAPASFVVR
jgi:hypothetical protein